MTELVDEPQLLQRRIASLREVLATGVGIAPDELEWRVAASTVHLGLIARLIAPTLAVAVLTDRAPASALSEYFWQPALGGAYPLSIPRPPSQLLDVDGDAGAGQVAADLSTWITTGPVEQLTRAVRAAGGVSEKVLRGNVASALHSAAEQIDTNRPDLSGRAAALLDTVTSDPTLRGTGRILPSGLFRRNSCCLIYRAVRPVLVGAGRAVCGDCILTAD